MSQSDDTMFTNSLFSETKNYLYKMKKKDKSKPILFKDWFYDGVKELGEPTKNANILTLSPPKNKKTIGSLFTTTSKSKETNKLIIKLINALKYLLYKLSNTTINIETTVDDVNTISDSKELETQKEHQISLLNIFNDEITEQIKIHKQEALLLQKNKDKKHLEQPVDLDTKYLQTYLCFKVCLCFLYLYIKIHKLDIPRLETQVKHLKIAIQDELSHHVDSQESFEIYTSLQNLYNVNMENMSKDLTMYVQSIEYIRIYLNMSEAIVGGGFKKMRNKKFG